MIDQQPLDFWAIAIVLLFAKMAFIVFYQARYRLRSKVFTKPEDAARWGDGTVSERDVEEVERAQRALRNDLENIPIFLFLSFAYLLYDAWELGGYLYITVFVLARIAHTWAYLRPRQPHRFLAYTVGLTCSMLVAGHVFWEALQG